MLDVRDLAAFEGVYFEVWVLHSLGVQIRYINTINKSLPEHYLIPLMRATLRVAKSTDANSYQSKGLKHFCHSS
jgi:hypothetical protein